MQNVLKNAWKLLEEWKLKDKRMKITKTNVTLEQIGSIQNDLIDLLRYRDNFVHILAQCWDEDLLGLIERIMVWNCNVRRNLVDKQELDSM